jgi:catechol 2,3-dioxygenase-like lactoylglutathione lyase family enzyme
MAEAAPSIHPAFRAIRNLDYTVVFARDLAAMRRFYEHTLGFTVERQLGSSWIEFRVGHAILALTERGLLFDDPAPPHGALSLQLAFRMTRDEVDACAEALRALGVSVESGPTDQPWGHRTLFFRDPDGNVLECFADI